MKRLKGLKMFGMTFAKKVTDTQGALHNYFCTLTVFSQIAIQEPARLIAGSMVYRRNPLLLSD
jgi:hypothetical protein